MAKLPELFMEYSRTHPGLVRQRREFVHYLSGGMAVKLLLKAKRVKASSLVKKTTDFDFVFGVPKKLSFTTMTRKFNLMDRIMSRHLFGFERWLRTKYKLDCRVLKTYFDPPRQTLYNPVANKRLFRTIQFKVHIQGQSKAEGIADASLVYIPGVRREKVLEEYTAQLGMPIMHLKYQYKSTMHILAGAFSSFADKDTSIKSRNPLTGTRKEKGLKNVARIKNLIRAHSGKSPLASTATKSMIRHIERRSVNRAFKAASRVLRNISPYKE